VVGYPSDSLASCTLFILFHNNYSVAENINYRQTDRQTDRDLSNK